MINKSEIYVDTKEEMFAAMRRGRGNKGLSLGEIIQKLKAIPSELDGVEINALDSSIVNVTAYRGRYGDICLCIETKHKTQDYAQPLIVAGLRSILEQIVKGKTLWSKNGEISYTKEAVVWVSEEKCTDGLFVTDLVFEVLSEADTVFDTVPEDNVQRCPGFVGLVLAHIPYFVEMVKYQQKADAYVQEMLKTSKNRKND